LEAYFEAHALGRVYNAPIDVVLAHQDVFEPDIVVVTDPSLATLCALWHQPLLDRRY